MNPRDWAFLPAGKYKRFLQIDTIILGVRGQVCPSYRKCKFAWFLNAENDESSLQIDTVMGEGQASQSSQNRKFAMSLKYLTKES